MKLTDNQIKGIKHLEWASYNDNEFRTNVGADMRFVEILNCGIWTLEQLEELGSGINKDRKILLYNHKSNEGAGKRKLINKTKTNPTIIKYRRSRKFSMNEQFENRRGVFTDRDHKRTKRLMNRPIK